MKGQFYSMGYGKCYEKISDSGNKNILVTERGASFDITLGLI